MNSHYQPYYSATDNTPPADYHKLNPRMFLTVGEKDSEKNPLKFQFIIGIKLNANKKLNEISDITPIDIDPFLCPLNGILTENSTLLNVVKYWLKQALTQHGIGAKTAVGYGYMK